MTKEQEKETKPEVVQKQSLTHKAVDIKGKQYVLVADRVLYFNEIYTDGSIRTKILSDFDSDRIIVKATVCPNMSSEKPRIFVGHAQEVVGDGYINKTSALENAETSAVGRALAMMGIGVIESIASVDEIHKATNQTNQPTPTVSPSMFERVKKAIGDIDNADKLEATRKKVVDSDKYTPEQKKELGKALDVRAKDFHE